MGGVKRTPADIAFSDCIRERDNWTCQACGKYYPEGQRMGIECSHFHSRGNWSIRFHPLNAEALCTYCHFHHGGTRLPQVRTEFEQELLLDMKNDLNLGKMYKKTKGKGDIAKHYREEFKRMQKLRAEGVTGRIEFEAWL